MYNQGHIKLIICYKICYLLQKYVKLLKSIECNCGFINIYGIQISLDFVVKLIHENKYSFRSAISSTITIGSLDTNLWIFKTVIFIESMKTDNP